MAPRFRLALILWFFISSLSLPAAAEPDSANSPRFLVHLLDYLAKDYGGAVANGKVISTSEYEEQQSFSQAARDTFSHLPSLQNDQNLAAGLTKLSDLIRDKAPAEEVSRLARSLQADVIRISGLEITPRHTPDRVRGGQIYAETCVACHGAEGRGDGPAGAGLDPKPANFLDPEAAAERTIFQAFNAIRLGIPGTGMQAFAALSDDDVWNVADYVTHLHKGDAQQATVQEAAPTIGPNHFLTTARHYYQASQEAYGNGDKAGAKMKALSAYLEGVEPLEPRVKSFDPTIVVQLETNMGSLLKAIEAGAPAPEVNDVFARLTGDLDRMEATLTETNMSPSVAFVAASAILLREGFEAVLMIIALLGVIKATGARRAALWVHGGWIAAVACGIAAWFFSGFLLNMSGASREGMEAFTSLFAVAVLLIVGFWLHRQTEITRWKAFIDQRVKAALEGRKLLALSSIAFIAVFREAFETVIFLRAIWQESAESSRLAMGFGVLLSFALVITIATAVLRYSARFPIRKLFGFSAMLMAFLAFVLSGKGVHSLQEVGIVSVSTLGTLRVEWLGLFPTVETITAQIVTLAVVAALWVYGKRPSPSSIGSQQTTT